ncbi:hypothetical protein C8J56DRAFT_904222 [Mycena floridula]|nr:hypothetical protein C8J56DRAFT_904222 [Mycena floridula]
MQFKLSAIILALVLQCPKSSLEQLQPFSTISNMQFKLSAIILALVTLAVATHSVISLGCNPLSEQFRENSAPDQRRSKVDIGSSVGLTSRRAIFTFYINKISLLVAANQCTPLFKFKPQYNWVHAGKKATNI